MFSSSMTRQNLWIHGEIMRDKCCKDEGDS